METTMTIRQAGAEGVVRALADGMQAAQYARALETAKAERDALETKVKALTDENALQQREINRLRKQCREYRFSRSQAYRATLDAQAHGSDSRLSRFLARLLLVLSGSVLTFAVVTAIIWGSRI